MKKNICGTVEKQDFFLKQINPVNLKKSSVPQYLRSAAVNKIEHFKKGLN